MANLKNTIINDTGFLTFPSGSEAQRPNSPQVGYTRMNTDSHQLEIYDGTEWKIVTTENITTLYVTDGLVLNLDAADASSYPGTGTTWTDLSGNGNDGTLVNGVGFNSANSGSLSFDGTDDLVTVNSTNDLNLSISNFSIEMWLYGNTAMDSGNNYHSVVEIPGQFVLGIWRSGLHPGDFFNTFGGSTMFGTDNSSSYTGGSYKSTGVWSHVVFTRDGGTMYFYINGQQWASKSTPSLTNQSNSLRIGRFADGTLSYNGLIPVFRFYTQTLSLQDVQTNYNGIKGRFGL